MVQSGGVASAEWLRKRKLTTIAFAVQNLFIGIEYGIFVVNLWLYLTELVNTVHPQLFYSIISVAYLVSASTSSVIICRFADRSRKVRRIIFLTNIAYIVGNIMYMVPFYPILLLIGRIIAGIGQASRSVMSGEMARCYPEEQVASVFSIMGAVDCLGFMIAPALNIIFNATDIRIGGWRITYANVSGIYIPVIFVLSQLMTFWMVANLSQEYDLKSEYESQQQIIIKSSNSEADVEFNNENAETMHSNISVKSSSAITNSEEDTPLLQKEASINVLYLLKQLFTHYDTCLLLALQLLETFFVVSMDMILPILIVGTLQWSHTAYNVIMLGTGLFGILPSIFLMFKTLADKTIYSIALPSLLAYALLQLVQMMWALKVASTNVNIFMAVVYSVLFTDIVIIRDVFVGSFLARMVSSRFQSSSDSIRLSMSRIGAIVAMSTAAYVVPKIKVIGSLLIAIVFVFTVLLFSRRKTMKNPVVIIK